MNAHLTPQDIETFMPCDMFEIGYHPSEIHVFPEGVEHGGECSPYAYLLTDEKETPRGNPAIVYALDIDDEPDHPAPPWNPTEDFENLPEVIYFRTHPIEDLNAGFLADWNWNRRRITLGY